MVDRKEMGLERQGEKIVSGDFDIILFPFNATKVFFERAAVWEVKIARPHARKLNKSSKSMGT